jgi:hypothetical protein
MLISLPNDVVDDEDLHESTIFPVENILSIQLATDIDPLTPSEALIAAATANLISQTTLVQILGLQEKLHGIDKTAKPAPRPTSGILSSWFGGGPGAVGSDGAIANSELLYGTTELRKFCPDDQLELAFAIILPDK